MLSGRVKPQQLKSGEKKGDSHGSLPNRQRITATVPLKIAGGGKDEPIDRSKPAYSLLLSPEFSDHRFGSESGPVDHPVVRPGPAP